MNICVKRLRLILVSVFEDFPSGRNPNSEVVAAAALNGASRLQYINPRQGRTRGGSGGIAQPTFPSISHGTGRWIKLYWYLTNTESLSEAMAWLQSCVYWHIFLKRELLNDCLAKCLSIKLFNVFLKPLIMDLWQKIEAGGDRKDFFSQGLVRLE